MVRLYEWNPRPHEGPRVLGRRVRYGPRRENFGDRLGPLIARGILRRHGVRDLGLTGPRLLSVGSVLHFARSGDHVWGTGRNGKIADDAHRFTDLSVTAVRGPLTREFLHDRGIATPEVYGDPAVLLPDLFPGWAATAPRAGVVFVPNLNDRTVPPGIEVVSPIGAVPAIVRRITGAEWVVASSLHGVVVAEAYGVPARLVVPEHESLLKYRDYYASTGRADETFARTAVEALAAGPSPLPVLDRAPLLAAFPLHLWSTPGLRPVAS